jgi:hypothetical protein
LYIKEKQFNKMSNHIIRFSSITGLHWETLNPFLFCAHHNDVFPGGNDAFGPDASLAGRDIGQDFTLKDGWRMYHGLKVPGFPMHPHRGFETVTIGLKGYVDHSDSFGASGRYGNGDVQWMTAGSGMQHAEMFPLLNKEGPNHAELFQLWLNLPASGKFVAPWYKMLWVEEIPVVSVKDEHGRVTEIKVIAGKIGSTKALPPAPDSWAADPANEVAIWLIKMKSGAEWVLPASETKVNRMVYFYEGTSLTAGNQEVNGYYSFVVDSQEDILLKNGPDEGCLLVLQGRPIDEPVVQYGPFVMNTDEEIREAFRDYRATQFGGWPWDRNDPVHGPDKTRFARYSNGEIIIRK